MTTAPTFCQFLLSGTDAHKFLQGQLTINIQKVCKLADTAPESFLPCAICNLKGRVQFGLWIKAVADGFCLVISCDCADEFVCHIKKYGAFSKITLSDPTPIYPSLINATPSFSDTKDTAPLDEWQRISIRTGNYWITKATQNLFQPQELRLHQRGGVDYDKGCYLGQEVVARLYFKAAPKAFLHRVLLHETISTELLSAHLTPHNLTDHTPANIINQDLTPLSGQKAGQGVIVNACVCNDTPNDFNAEKLALETLMVIRPDMVAQVGKELTIDNLTGSVARQSS